MYRIKNWPQYFEKAQSRKLRTMKWVAVPNKQDGKTFNRLKKLENRVNIFAAWILMLEIASKAPKRGYLIDNDGALNSEDMSDITGFPQDIFDEAIEALTNSRIGWIERIEE